MTGVVGIEGALFDNEATGGTAVGLRHPDVDEDDLAPGLWENAPDRSVADDNMVYRVGLEDRLDHLAGTRVICLGEGPVPERAVRVAGHAGAGVDTLAYTFVELVQRHGGVGAAEAGVNKEDVVELDDTVETAEPLSVEAPGSDRGTEFRLVPEGLHLPRVQVAPVAPQDHLLVVADEAVHVAAGLFRLDLQLHQEIHGLAGVRSPVEEVPGLYEMGLSADPVGALVDDLRGEECFQELAMVAMDIADRHDALDAVPCVLLALLLGGNRSRGEREDEN